MHSLAYGSGGNGSGGNGSGGPRIWDLIMHSLAYGSGGNGSGGNGSDEPRIWDLIMHSLAYGLRIGRQRLGRQRIGRATDLGPENALTDPRDLIEDPSNEFRSNLLWAQGPAN